MRRIWDFWPQEKWKNIDRPLAQRCKSIYPIFMKMEVLQIRWHEEWDRCMRHQMG